MINLPTGVDIKNLIDDLRTWSWEASDILLYYFQILRDTNIKSNIIKNDNFNDPVTLADLKVNETIIQRINEKYANVNWQIISEENVKLDHNDFDINSDWVWFLDPLDGTKDFIQGTNNYAMHLGLSYKRKPYIGIVLIPQKNELWFSYRKEVWCEKKDGSKSKPHFSIFGNLEDKILVTSKNHRNEALKKLIQKINFKDVKVMGSIGCKITSILRGESDIYICLSLPSESSPKDWDFAAPHAILKAAGGIITDLENKELTYGKLNFEQSGVIIASNDVNTHRSLCLEIKDVIEKNKIFPI